MENTEIGNINKPSVSKINWINTIAVIIAAAVNLGILAPEMANSINATLVTVMPVINIILRTFFTKKQI